MFHDRTPRRELQNVEEQLAAPQAPVPVMGTADTVPKRGFDGGEIGSGEASENGEKMFVDFG